MTVHSLEVCCMHAMHLNMRQWMTPGPNCSNVEERSPGEFVYMVRLGRTVLE